MARLAFLSASSHGMQVPILNGFVMAIKRDVFSSIGYMVGLHCQKLETHYAIWLPLASV